MSTITKSSIFRTPNLATKSRKNMGFRPKKNIKSYTTHKKNHLFHLHILTLIHTYTPALARTYLHAYARIHTHPHTRTHTRRYAHSHAYTPALARIRIHTIARTHKYAGANTCEYTRNARTYVLKIHYRKHSK